MRDALLAQDVRHARHSHAADHAAEVEHILLHDGERAVGDQPAEVVRTGFLLAAGDGNAQRIGDLPGLLVPVEGHRLLVECVLIFLH